MSSKVKEAIEEMIEESYLLGLSEEEIRQDFKRFIDACYTVVQQNVKDRAVVSGLAESLAREQTVLLIADRAETPAAEPAVGEVDDELAEGVASQEFSEKVARRKRQILRTIAQYDPQLVRLIDAQRFQGEAEEPARPALARRVAKTRRPRRQLDWAQVRLQLLKLGYATTIAVIVLLVWLGFMQSGG